MIVTIHQPNLLPRLKVLQKIAASDVWIVLDDVQYVTREYQNRAMLVDTHGSNLAHWCTLPISLPNGRSTLINEVILNIDNGIEYIELAISHSFKGTDTFKTDRDIIYDQIRKARYNLVDICVQSTVGLLKCANVCPKVIYSSSIKNKSNEKSSRLAELCEHIGAKKYLCDSGGENYLDEDCFKERNIDILWQDWKAPNTKNANTIRGYIRNGSGINLLARSKNEYLCSIKNIYYKKSGGINCNACPNY